MCSIAAAILHNPYPAKGCPGAQGLAKANLHSSLRTTHATANLRVMGHMAPIHCPHLVAVNVKVRVLRQRYKVGVLMVHVLPVAGLDPAEAVTEFGRNLIRYSAKRC